MAENKAPEVPAPEAPAVETPKTPEVPAAQPEVAKVAENVKESVGKVSSWMKAFSTTQSGKVIVMLVVGIALAFLTGYILYYGINKTISNQQSYLIPETKVPVLATQESSFAADKVPNAGNGKRSSLSFWIYIYDNNKYSGVRKHVLHRGDEAGTDLTGGASPYIYLDQNTNKLYVTFAPADATKLFVNGTNTYNFASASDSEKMIYLNAVRGITIDYIPLQRWVNVVVVVNEDATVGGSITAYVDGEFVKSVTAKTDLTNSGQVALNAAGTAITPVPSFNVTDVDLDKKGNIYTGGSIGSTVGPGFSGMVSMVQFFNYDMNANDVYRLYLKGPVDNLLAKAGLPAYGIQSPIYRIG